MLSIKPLTDDSYPIALLKQKKTVLETIYFTEPTRKMKTQKTPFEKQIGEYLEKVENKAYTLHEDYTFEMAPTITVNSGTNPRFINFYLSASNSGKSYQIAQLCRRYLQLHPDNLIAYASANPIENDVNYTDIRDKIEVVDVLNLESQIDFQDEQYRNSLWIFDDCDSGFSATMEDLDSRLTPEELNNLSVTDKQKALAMLKKKCEIATEWINKSIKSFMMNGRKMKQSLCIVGHKPFEGRGENQIINEATGIVLFPTGIRKNILERFIAEKLSFTKQEADEIINKHDWYRYDWLYISHRSSTPFTVTQETIKLFK
jgi:hypothetical protein